MTVGKDVSTLFPDVIQCMQTPSLELKKLVYLYLINYAKSKPELAILAVNTFIKDAQDPNPLVRALAVRTMGCIRVERITEYLCDPLQLALTDDDPYVRKTAVICVAKLFDIDQELVENRGFIDSLLDVVHNETNPTVLSNAAASLLEISQKSATITFQVTDQVMKRLITTLPDCTEWGQVYILEALQLYVAPSQLEAEALVERVSAHLQHSNGAVVLTAIRLLMKQFEFVSAGLQSTLKAQIASSLVTLLGSESEVQFVALREILRILPMCQEALERHLQVFFCKYNDPYFIKHAKLNVILQLMSVDTVHQVLTELKEYSSEVDLDFARQSIKALGRCAIEFEIVAEDTVALLVELIHSRVNYIVQEAIVIMKDIVRQYPNRFEHTIPILCAALSVLDRPEAKASLIWMVGEYAERIENATFLLKDFCDTFEDESDVVQLQILTSSVKTFLKHQDANTQRIVQRVLHSASSSESPDLRDRALIYWRLLSSGTAVAGDVISP
jgi:AP-1 complex subunit beta-1